MTKEKDFIQRSLVVLKPDAVQRGIVGEIVQRFERVGLKIVGMKMIMPDEHLYREHYEGIGQMITRRGEQVFQMGTIRGDFSHMSFGYSDAKGTGVPNLVHASSNQEEAKKEIDLWFNANELYDYSDLNEKYTR